jgi:hypothetical protein
LRSTRFSGTIRHNEGRDSCRAYWSGGTCLAREFYTKKADEFIDACPRCQPVIASLRESKPEQVRLVDLRSEQFIARWMIQF